MKDNYRLETTWKPLRARCSPSTASRATEKRDELQRAAAGVDTSTPAGIRREYAEYAPAGTRRAYPKSRRKAPAFAPRRFLTLFSSEGEDRGAAGPRARAAPCETRARLDVLAPPRARHRHHRIGYARIVPFPDHVISPVFALFTHAAGVSPVDGVLRGSGQHGAAARVLGGDDVRDGCAAGGRRLRGL